MSATGTNDERGFTLVEALVVLAILGMIAAIGFPAMDRAIGAQQRRLATIEAEAAFHAARAQAIRTARPVKAGHGLIFYPDGSSSGGTVTLDSGLRLSVIAGTGAIERLP